MKKLSMALVLFSATAYAQSCPGYAHEYDITLQAGSITGTLANYTLLVSGTYPYLAVGGAGGVTSALGYDITFVQGVASLKWSMPIYVSGTGQIKVNVLLPSAAAGTVFAMCTGNASVKSFQGGVNPYDANTNLALNFTSAGLALDDTGQHTGTVNAATYSASAPTYLGDAASFTNGTPITLDDTGFPTGGSKRTISWWHKFDTTAGSQILFQYGVQANTNLFYLYVSGNGKLALFNGSGGTNSANALIDTAWHRYDVQYDDSQGTQLRYFVDGVQDTLTGVTALNTILNGTIQVGGINGRMAAFKLATGLRTPEWIAAEYRNQTAPASVYAIVAAASLTGPVVSAATIVANSPLSVKATWTTDIASNSRVSCGTVSGGPYTYASHIVNPNANGWNVTAHSMASNPMPNGTVYCIITSVSPNGGVGYSAEFGPIVLPGAPPSLPIAMVTPVVKLMSKLGDRFNGTNGAPNTKTWGNLDNGYGCWADDNNEYFADAQWGLPDGTWREFGGRWGASGYVKFTDSAHTIGTLQGTDWQNGINNLAFSPHPMWGNFPCLSVKGSIYVAAYNMDTFVLGGLTKTTDYFQSTLAPNHNVGPDTTYITTMTCDSTPVPGTVHAASKLNITDELPVIALPGKMAMLVAGANGTGVNGIFGGSVTATATTISWTNPGGTCAGWSWSPTGGTGSGGGTINVYGWDVPSVGPSEWIYGAWVQNDGPGYTTGTPAAGMDAFAYWFAGAVLKRMRVEDLPLQGSLGGVSKIQCYKGNQSGDDGIYEQNWGTTNCREMNSDQFRTRSNGKGSIFPQYQYLTALNRFVLAFQISGVTDSSSGGTAIYDAGPYPWSPIEMIGSAQRNVDVYYHMGSGPEFPQFIAKSQTSANGVTSINLEHNGGNFGGIVGNPSANEYDMYMNAGLQFVAKAPTAPAVSQPMLAVGEVSAGMELAYNFDVHPGSMSMPNAAPSDAKQKWAWKALDSANPIWTDPYGSILHSLPARSSAGGFFPSGFIQNMGFPTPYAEALPGPLTLMDCFGHYPTTLLSLPSAGAIALKKGTDLSITWAGAKAGTVTFAGTTITAIALATGGSGYTSPPPITITGDFRVTTAATATAHLTGGVITSITIDNGGAGFYQEGLTIAIPEPTNNWAVSFLGTLVGNVSIPDNSIGCAVVRRDSSNRVSLYTSAGIGKSLPLTPFATITVAGPWTSSPLVIGDGGVWGTPNVTEGNSFWGVESLLRVWSRDIADDELIAEMAAIRSVLWGRGKGSAIP